MARTNSCGSPFKTSWIRGNSSAYNRLPTTLWSGCPKICVLDLLNQRPYAELLYWLTKSLSQ